MKEARRQMDRDRRLVEGAMEEDDVDGRALRDCKLALVKCLQLAMLRFERRLQRLSSDWTDWSVKVRQPSTLKETKEGEWRRIKSDITESVNQPELDRETEWSPIALELSSLGRLGIQSLRPSEGTESNEQPERIHRTNEEEYLG